MSLKLACIPLARRGNDAGLFKQPSREASECLKECRHPGDAKQELQDLITKHVHGGAELLEARGMTFAELAEDCRKNRYCQAIYDKNGCKLAGVRDPRKFTSIINRLVAHLGHLKLSEISVRDLQTYRTIRLKTKTRRGELTDVATVNRELSTCRAMLNDTVTNDWLYALPLRKGQKG
jgi:hypothetical protein